MINKTFLPALLCLPASPLLADDAIMAANSDNLVVIGNRFPQPRPSVLAATSVVTRHDIERWQAKSLIDVMRRLPGVDIAQNGGIGQPSAIFIRGSEARHTLLLVDGVRLNQAGVTGSSDISQIPLSLVQRIEFIRGPRSAIYGSDAIGGVINIITTRENTGSKISASVGSHGYQSYDAGTQTALGDSTVVTLAGNYTYSRGYDVVAGLPDSSGTPAQPDRDGFLSRAIYASVQQTFNPQWRGFFRGYGYHNRTAYDGFYSYNDPDHLDALPNTRQLDSYTWQGGLNYRAGRYGSQLLASISHSKDYDFDQRYGRYSRSATLDDVTQYNLNWGNTFQFAQSTIGTGIDWQQQTLSSGYSQLSHSNNWHNTGIYLTALRQIDTLTVEGALRADNNSQFGWHHTWQASTAWEPVLGYRALFSYGTAFKGPNQKQLYGGSWANPELQPEQSRQWEVGFEASLDTFTWRLAGYHNEIHHLIDYVLKGGDFAYYNIGQAVIRGIELNASWDMGRMRHQLSYDYSDPRDAETNQKLLRRAKTQIKYELNGELYNFDWSLTYLYIGERYDRDYSIFPSPTLKLGGVSLWDLAAAYPLTSHLTVHGRIANLFDKNYETAYGYAKPGREYYLTGSYTF
ncbi:TonB-dependent vitamin B12 receptor BtuB [Serratia microhaemolytica]|uniref:TonB-dependent vitamin B12 receptor BtuB n=1 Tax=Serratia microhaemolytica TaxID=2675110 RepID=UPI000FDCF83E|nr:TonB-dependent vitamin B12 receptor BtuB [Serratia microhaemolytica]